MAEIIDFKKGKENQEEKSKEDLAKNFLKCSKCGGLKFEEVFLFKVVTPFEDPELDKNMIMPIQAFVCTNCGEVLNIYTDEVLKDNN